MLICRAIAGIVAGTVATIVGTTHGLLAWIATLVALAVACGIAEALIVEWRARRRHRSRLNYLFPPSILYKNGINPPTKQVRPPPPPPPPPLERAR